VPVRQVRAEERAGEEATVSDLDFDDAENFEGKLRGLSADNQELRRELDRARDVITRLQNQGLDYAREVGRSHRTLDEAGIAFEDGARHLSLAERVARLAAAYVVLQASAAELERERARAWESFDRLALATATAAKGRGGTA
jgi:chromosome segregation ATPase